MKAFDWKSWDTRMRNFYVTRPRKHQEMMVDDGQKLPLWLAFAESSVSLKSSEESEGSRWKP